MFQLLPQSNTPRWVIILIDLVISSMALGFAYVIRFDLKADEEMIHQEWMILSRSIVIFFLVKAIVFYLFSIHKGLVRHTSTADMKRIFFAVATCSLLFLGLGFVRVFWFDGYFLFPTSVLLIEFLSSFVLMIGLRFTVKLLYLESIKNKDEDERILIYGAGISGLITKRTIEKDARISYKIIGFIDDNKKLDGTRLEGLKIYHSNKLDNLIKEEGVTQVIVAIQNPSEKNKQNILETCIRNDVKVQKVPSPKSWINGEFSTKQIGKIQIEDLLGRDPIVLSEDKIKTQISGKIILVSGAAGSIGSGLVKQILEHKPKKILLLDQAESPMYDLNNELLGKPHSSELEVIIGDIRNKERMQRLFAHAKPDIIYHAAAYKHVPLMESNPSEAIKTNVEGTRNLVDCALEFEVGKFVMISTDKAVNPTNVMGASKRIAEMYAQLANQKGQAKFITTRFGNVLGSNGSVIPLFQKQIEQGGPITLTDERITRFFMTIPEACQLVLEAGAMGEGGEVFVFDMGESVKIIDLAKKMIKLNGLELGKDIEIKVTGLRPGEKLYEELLADDENTLPTHHPLILKAKVREIEASIEKEIDELIQLFGTQDNHKLVAKMKSLVPEYVSNNSEFEKLDKK
ncbi:MAG: nucleoside-diphosphate sugar epimerase/dehydratase [Crocinitomicaceae bacterium]|nr:nucleoside-diphosphate sugar epimerase/dehydratase [Crocinitomicaceae bacterium]MDG2464591.1 nucleoside-diphosphate sugar epimerase/dehydratase [Crocinitomicaceae bacterium]